MLSVCKQGYQLVLKFSFCTSRHVLENSKICYHKNKCKPYGVLVMHRQFQHDLYRLRLNTARSYVKALEHSMTPISSNPSEPLKLAAQVHNIM